MSDVSKHLRGLLSAKGWKQEDLCFICGSDASSGTIDRLLNGRTKLSVRMAKVMAAAFGCSAAELLRIQSDEQLEWIKSKPDYEEKAKAVRQRRDDLIAQKLNQPSEAQTQKAILDWLAAERVWHIRLNTGAMKGSYKGKGWFVRFGKPGMADILAATPDKWIVYLGISAAFENGNDITEQVKAKPRRIVPALTWIEVKAPKGVQSDEQKRFQEEVTEQGMTYILARSLDDVIAALK